MIKKVNPSNNPKKKRFSIPEFDVDVDFARDVIHILDSSTERILYTKSMDEIKPNDVFQKTFKTFKAKSESGKDYVVDVEFIKEHDSLSTNGESILDIRMDTPYHGFYFGLYEIGEFRINQNDLSLQLIDRFPYKYVGAGSIAIAGKEKLVNGKKESGEEKHKRTSI